MSNVQAVIIGAALIIGLVIHGALSGGDPIPQAQADMGQTLQRIESNRMHSLKDIEKTRAGAEKSKALLQTSQPKVLDLGDRQLIVDADFEKNGDGFSVRTKYYEYRDGALHRIELKDGLSDK